MGEVIHTDIFIAGAGAAGIAAAVAAAECGMNVCVSERNSFPGGRATASAVGTICGIYLRSHDAVPKFAMNGFPRKFAEQLMKENGKLPVKFAEGLWFLPSHPSDFELISSEFLAHKKIEVLFNTKIESVEFNDTTITAVHCGREQEKKKIIPQCVIECSGEGIICTSVNHEIIRDEEYQAAAIVFSMENISVKKEFQISFSLLKKITQEIESGNVPEYFNLLSIIPSSINGNSVLFKMGLPWKTGIESDVSLETKAKALVEELVIFVKGNVPGFESAMLHWIAKEIGVRTGIRAKGKNILSDEDVLTCRKYDDGITNGAWPIEYWKTGNKRVEMTYFAENDFYSIPAGCLESPEKENLFFGGKIISATEKTIASARVIGTCFGTGYAAGVLASFKVKNKSRAEAIDFIKQKML